MKNYLKRAAYFTVVVTCLTALVHAEGPDDQFLQLYSLIQEADRLQGSGQSTAARAKYVEVQTGLKKLQTSYPTWNDRVVQFRLRYVEEKIGALPVPLEAPASTPKPSVTPAPAATPPPAQPAVANQAQRDAQMQGMQMAILRLESDKAVLEAKLKEALTAQPAAVDPRELAKAEERIRNLEKEKELLRVSLNKEQARQARTVEPTALDDTKTALADITRRLAQEKEAAAALAREKELLEKQLKEARRTESNEPTRSKNEPPQKQADARIAKDEPSPRLAKLERELADAKTALDANNKLLAKLKDERSALEKAKNELEKKLAAATKSAGAQEKNSADRIKRLENERDDLQARLKQANKAGNRGSEREMAGLRAKLAALESQKIPFSPEELALFKQPALGPVKVAAAPEKKTSGPPPAGVAPLVAEAERSFAARRYADAEAKYQEAVKLDGNNATTLANLAATQLEQNKIEEADVSLKRALAAEPNDAQVLTLMGILRFRQDRFDDAFDALSRATQLDPRNAEAQNYLGITLSQKGQRAAAEAALRKAIQLVPGYASAHHNLAVIYATQTPPFLELARWHYEKALAAGHPKNPEMEKRLDNRSGSGK